MQNPRGGYPHTVRKRPWDRHPLPHRMRILACHGSQLSSSCVRYVDFEIRAEARRFSLRLVSVLCKLWQSTN